MAVRGRLPILAFIGFGLAVALSAPCSADTAAVVADKALPAKPVPAARESLPKAFSRDLPSSIDDLKTIESRVKAIVARVSPAVVSVTVGKAKGSAVVISADGLVLTAAHVNATPNNPVLFYFPDGRIAHGITLGTNHEMDSGLMRITDAGPWPFAPVGDLSRAQLGDWVVALGHPGGFDPNRPVVARLGRMIINTPTLIQTDCTLLGGDSGGPLFDMSGRVIAIHSAISDSAESNYHIPITTFLDTWNRLALGDNWGGGYVGATGVDHPDGFKVERVSTGSPAAKVGLKAGDVVSKINGELVKGSAAFQQTVSELNLGSEMSLQIKRAGVDMVLRLTVDEAPRATRSPTGAE